MAGYSQVFATARKAAQKMDEIADHALQRRIANEVRKSVEAVRGPTPQTALRLCDDYAKTVLGDAVFSPWLKVYTAAAGEFREGWIPLNYFERVVRPNIYGSYTLRLDNKTLSRRI